MNTALARPGEIPGTTRCPSSRSILARLIDKLRGYAPFHRYRMARYVPLRHNEEGPYILAECKCGARLRVRDEAVALHLAGPYLGGQVVRRHLEGGFVDLLP
ncbi:MAG: hypothetical protein F4X54_07380 [Chloroflexi bacterium]|nr:hypothetical protein [Chloroflexota bacterium]MYB84539.1 hypothetical protein [Chloroflexota bacterium]